MKISWNQRAFDRAAAKYGKRQTIALLITFPIWAPVTASFVWSLRGVAWLCQRIGDFGDWLGNKVA